ncbi:MAG: glycoside hydrolase family 25 protein [Planctomycetales bacterium]|nr:glycoside hydrolase family 25 protein [Planctomycetales bacterium]
MRNPTNTASQANSIWLLRVGLGLVCFMALPPVAWAQRARGVDASYWQGNMDWSKTYDAGARFAFVRSSRGLTYDDTRFVQNMTTISNMAAAGKTIYAGAYHYGIPSDALTSSSTSAAIEANARAEANHFVNTAGNYMTAGWLRPVLDLEDGGSLLDRSQLSSWANTFMNEVEARVGVEPLIYMNTNYATNYIDSSLADRDLWIANYNSGGVHGDPLTTGSPPTGNAGDWSFWQYTSLGSSELYGIPGNTIDLNVANGDINFVRGFVIPSSVPEPSGALVICGASLLAFSRRRRR